MAFDPRKNALLILNRLDSQDKTLDALMDAFHETHGATAKRDRALMQALVYGVLRHRSRIDGIISRFSKTGLRNITPPVLNILRMAIFQIVYLDRIPASAAVNTAVEMAKAVSAPWTVRFVNAILRKTAGSPLPSPRGPADEHSIPPWLFSRWQRRFGKRAAVSICRAVNAIPPITLRTNTLRTARSALLAIIAEHAEDISPTEFSPEGISLASPAGAVMDLPGFCEGFFQIQDEAAQLTGHLLSPSPGETVLDACAGLGGKTGHLAQLMKNSGLLYAMDRDARKLQSLETEMTRLGVTIVKTFPHDLSSPPADFLSPTFDRILLDAPCSGLGVLRRNPDAKWRVSEKEIDRLHQTQYGLLVQLAPLLKPAGLLVYVVCSTEPEETESVIEKFIHSHPGFRVDPVSDLEMIPKNCITEKGYFRTYPHRLSMDGFFAVRLRRSS